jgi:hypothetical protein
MYTLLSLFDYSGHWSAPFARNGWQVIQWDIKLADFMDAMFFDSVETALETLDSVDGIIAAVPCTDFASSGAWTWPAKDADGRSARSVELVHQVLRLVNLFRPTDPDYDGPFFWAVENPVGRIKRMTGLPGEAFWFHPCDYAGLLAPTPQDLDKLDRIRRKGGIGVTASENDFVIRTNAYSKRTGLWGEFNRAGLEALKQRIEPVPTSPQGSFSQRIGGTSARTKEIRSNTPLGFAEAFFKANHDHRICPLAEYDC